MEIKPRRISDRGGIITMPLKVNVPDPNDNSWEETNCPECGAKCWKRPFPKDSAKICLTEECVLCVH